MLKNGDSIESTDYFIFILLFNYWLHCSTDVLCFLFKVLGDFCTIEAKSVASQTDEYEITSASSLLAWLLLVLSHEG